MSEKIFDDLMDVVGGEDKVTYVCFIMDHSGSMLGNGGKAKENFNEQIETLKKETGEMETLVTVVEFSDKYKVVTENEKVQFVKKMDKYPCNGSKNNKRSLPAGSSDDQNGNGSKYNITHIPPKTTNCESSPTLTCEPVINGDVCH